MVAVRSKMIVGVDGGGSRCRAALVTGAHRFEAETGPANVSSDFAGALDSIRAALTLVAAKACLSLDELAPASACLGIAGVTGPADAARLAAALPFVAPDIGDDRATTVAGALGATAGTVAAIGTGSFLGRRAGGNLRLIGGWGLRLGDEASAAWLGREALAATLLACDGLAGASPLTEALLAEHGSQGIVGFSATARPADYGCLAPRVVRAAEAGDPVASALMRRGADYIMRALAALGWRAGEPLVLIGGAAAPYARYLGPEAASALRPPAGSALDGALALASARADAP